jgi:7-cyano-7-deazaguanine synthase
VLLSGGIDSATALYLTKAAGPVRALTFEYHGIARRELEAARKIAASAGVSEHRMVRLPDLREAGDIGVKFAGLPSTYIPLRNSIFYSFAASYAEEVGASSVVGGHNKDDEKTFHDVGSGFFAALEEAFREASPALRARRIRISRPLKSKSKPQVVRLASSLGVPLELTWSCHRDGRGHCWECNGCLTRRESFARAGVPDPLVSLEGRKLLKQ